MTKNILLIAAFCAAGFQASVVLADDIILNAEAELGSILTGAHLFGIHADAHVDLDDWDLAEPPHPPSDYLSLAFAMPGSDVPLPNRWRNEFRSLDDLDDGIEIWELHIESDHLEEVATLTIELVEGPDSGLDVFVLGPDGPRFAELPLVMAIPIIEDHLVYWIEINADESVGAVSRAWSEIKTLYR